VGAPLARAAQATMTLAMGVRLSEAGDHKTLTQVLARAFDDDPIQRWVFPGARVRARYGGAFFRWSLWRCSDQQVTWTTDDLAGAAVWNLPDRWQVSVSQLAKLGQLIWRVVCQGGRHEFSCLSLVGLRRGGVVGWVGGGPACCARRGSD
jgi:hypothetical protein